ncbi:MAG: hypothetical protein CBC27_04730, partial [Opitutia bacterium TMED67]
MICANEINIVIILLRFCAHVETIETFSYSGTTLKIALEAWLKLFMAFLAVARGLIAQLSFFIHKFIKYVFIFALTCFLAPNDIPL